MGSLAWMALADGAAAPPQGPISPLAWAIILALCGVIVAVVPALWVRGNKMQDKMYEDYKECMGKKSQLEDDVLGLMKVLRLQMEASRGGKR